MWSYKSHTYRSTLYAHSTALGSLLCDFIHSHPCIAHQVLGGSSFHKDKLRSKEVRKLAIVYTQICLSPCQSKHWLIWPALLCQPVHSC